MASFHLEILDKQYCTNELLIIFSRAHMSYINQIFGDATIREIIQEIYKLEGKLIIEPGGANFEHSVHHVYYYNADEEPSHNNNNNTVNNATVNNYSNVKNNANNNSKNNSNSNAKNNSNNDDFISSKVCSVDLGFQDIHVDVNDTLCQSYSLASYLQVPFDNTPSKNASVELKFEKHRALIHMYRMLLENKAFIRELNAIITNKDNKQIWQDTIDDENPFFIIEKFKKPKVVIDKIRTVLDIWERYGWQFFVGDGKCRKVKQDGGKRKTRKVKRCV
jgi:hypothetical protein